MILGMYCRAEDTVACRDETKHIAALSSSAVTESSQPMGSQCPIICEPGTTVAATVAPSSTPCASSATARTKIAGMLDWDVVASLSSIVVSNPSFATVPARVQGPERDTSLVCSCQLATSVAPFHETCATKGLPFFASTWHVRVYATSFGPQYGSACHSDLKAR